MKFLDKTIEYVDEQFGEKRPHYVQTLYWLLKLKPGADEALQIAAYSHDVERGGRAETFPKRLIYDNPADEVFHQKEGGRKMYDFLIQAGATEELASKVREIISLHEYGGTDDQNIIKDADSISYLEVNAPRHVNWLESVGEEEIRQKFSKMLNRITSPKAKKFAKPLYTKAIKMLDDKLNKTK